MALEGPYGTGECDRPPERQLRSRSPDAEAAAEPVEPRSRTEYYEMLHATVSGSVRTGDRPEHSGWDAIAADDRPRLDALRISPERTTHILDGDPTPAGGGGHRSGTGKPGKTEFPAGWDDKKVMDRVLDVARRPDSPPVHQHWNDRWVCSGTRDRVEVSVVVLRSGEVWTAWPEEGGPGVVRIPRKETS
jgi:hypothetical protein